MRESIFGIGIKQMMSSTKQTISPAISPRMPPIIAPIIKEPINHKIPEIIINYILIFCLLFFGFSYLAPFERLFRHSPLLNFSSFSTSILSKSDWRDRFERENRIEGISREYRDTLYSIKTTCLFFIFIQISYAIERCYQQTSFLLALHHIHQRIE